MKKTQTFFSICLLVLFIAGMADARLYKWMDEKSVAHFSDTPPTHGKKSGKVESVSQHKDDGTPAVSYSHFETQRGNNPSNTVTGTSLPDNGHSNTASGTTRPPEKNRGPKVELYSTSWCGYCKMAANFFRSKGIPFTEYDIEKNKAAARRKQHLDKGRSGVPFAVINGTLIHGFSKASYERALK